LRTCARKWNVSDTLKLKRPRKARKSLKKARIAT